MNSQVSACVALDGLDCTATTVSPCLAVFTALVTDRWSVAVKKDGQASSAQLPSVEMVAIRQMAIVRFQENASASLVGKEKTALSAPHYRVANMELAMNHLTAFVKQAGLAHSVQLQYVLQTASTAGANGPMNVVAKWASEEAAARNVSPIQVVNTALVPPTALTRGLASVSQAGVDSPAQNDLTGAKHTRNCSKRSASPSMAQRIL